MLLIPCNYFDRCANYGIVHHIRNIVGVRTQYNISITQSVTAKAFPTVSQYHYQAILIIHNLIDLQLLKPEEHLIIFITMYRDY